MFQPFVFKRNARQPILIFFCWHSAFHAKTRTERRWWAPQFLKRTATDHVAPEWPILAHLVINKEGSNKVGDLMGSKLHNLQCLSQDEDDIFGATSAWITPCAILYKMCHHEFPYFIPNCVVWLLLQQQYAEVVYTMSLSCPYRENLLHFQSSCRCFW